MLCHYDPDEIDLPFRLCLRAGTVLIILTWSEDRIDASSPQTESRISLRCEHNFFFGYSHICRCKTVHYMYPIRAAVIWRVHQRTTMFA